MTSRDLDGMERRHRHEHDHAPAEAEGGEVPLFAPSAHGATSNADREAMAMRSRAAGGGGGLDFLPGSNAGREAMAMRSRGGMAVDSGAADAAQRAGIGDVSGVRVHTDGAAAEAAASVQARAFTVGSDVYFGAGQYQPGTRAGDQLIGHELAHTAQQRGAGAEVQAKLEVTQSGDAREDEADVAGGAFAAASRGETVEAVALSSSPTAIAREALTTTHAAAEEEVLPEAKVRGAIAFNQGRSLPPTAWSKIAGVVGAAGATIDAALVQKIARFQQRESFDVDGRVGDMTLQRISQQPGGEGLEDLVQRDDILYLGLNPASRDKEMDQLEGAGASVTGVTGARGARNQDTAKVDGRTVDLGTPEGIEALMGSFPKLDAARIGALTSFFEGAGGNAKDELAQLARYLYDAEFGKRLFKRVVLSGHSYGVSIWGDDNGSIPFTDLATLATIFPAAVGQVEDLMLSACNTGQSEKLDQYTGIFPNLKSIWAYVGYSPSAATGSLRHVKEWEKATRGKADEDKMDAGREKVGRGSGDKDKNVALWSRETGAADATYKTDSPEANLDFDTLKASVDGAMSSYEDAFIRGVIDQSALNALFTQLQALVGMFGSQLGDDRDAYATAMRRTLALRHWHNVLGNFMNAHGDALASAWGGSMPRDFGTASRAKVLAYLTAFSGDKTSDAYTTAVSMLHDLDGIPDNWN
jgi:hypothetical protein